MAGAKLYVLSIDALPYSMLQGFLARNKLPNFQKLEKLGWSCSGMLASGPDSTTPPAHAALLCGCKAKEHGICSFEEPLVEKGVVHPWKKVYGFDAFRLKAEPLWVKLLQAGKSCALLHFPLATPIEAFTSAKKFGADFSGLLTVVESFSQRLTPEIVRRDVNADDSFKLRLSDRSKELVPKRAPHSEAPLIFPDKPGGLWRMRFGSENPLDQDIHFLMASSGIQCNRPGLAQSYLEKVGPFISSAAAYSYSNDKLGPRIFKGGNGLAEKRLFRSMELMCRHFYDAIKFMLERTAPEAGFFYFNCIDLCLHLWMAFLDKSSPGFSQKTFEAVQPVVDLVFSWADRIVGLLLEAAGPEDFLVVTSDHGMAPIENIFYPNQALRDAGFLAWDEKEKEPILEQSSAVYSGSNAGYVILNLKSRGGIIPDEEAEAWTGKIAGVFEPHLGTALERIELPAQNREIPCLGEIYLVPKYKTTLQEEVEGILLKKEYYAGQHHYWADTESMKAVLYLKGPGAPAGKKAGVVSAVDVASLVAGLCGVEPPDKARRGRVKL
jgi:predicted AlkP superfamily phosphohydrolase/phosphomutase